LDVTEIEPLSAASPLWELPNVIITPHVGAQAARRENDVTDFFCENLRRYLADRPLLNLVDKELGFPHPDHAWIMTREESCPPMCRDWAGRTLPAV